MSLIGTHVSAAGGIWNAIARGDSLGCEAIQVFTRNQLQWKAPPISASAAARFMEAWKQSSIVKVVAHASYLINLASKGNTRDRSIVSLVEEINRCDLLGIDDIVLHPGSHLGEGIEKGQELVAEAINRVIDRTKTARTRILIETMSGQGNTIGTTIEEIAWIMERVVDQSRIGICLDTCHLFAGGHELRGRRSYERLVGAVERHVGSDRVGCWHLNDSKADMGSRLDRHAHLGEGFIGSDVFTCIVSDTRWDDTPCLLETPKNGPGDEGNLALLKKLRGY